MKHYGYTNQNESTKSFVLGLTNYIIVFMIKKWYFEQVKNYNLKMKEKLNNISKLIQKSKRNLIKKF